MTGEKERIAIVNDEKVAAVLAEGVSGSTIVQLRK